MDIANAVIVGGANTTPTPVAGNSGTSGTDLNSILNSVSSIVNGQGTTTAPSSGSGKVGGGTQTGSGVSLGNLLAAAGLGPLGPVSYTHLTLPTMPDV